MLVSAVSAASRARQHPGFLRSLWDSGDSAGFIEMHWHAGPRHAPRVCGRLGRSAGSAQHARARVNRSPRNGVSEAKGLLPSLPPPLVLLCIQSFPRSSLLLLAARLPAARPL